MTKLIASVALAAATLVMQSPIQAGRAGSESLSAPAPTCSITGTFRDCFTTNPLSSNWTSATASSYTTISSTGTGAKPSTSGSKGIMIYTGGTFSTTQQADALFSTYTSAGASGPIVRGSSTGDGFVYIIASKIVVDIVGGAGTATVLSGCPDPVDTHVYRLSISSAAGGTLICTDVNTSVSANVTGITAHPTGTPGVLIDQTASTSIILNKWGAS